MRYSCDQENNTLFHDDDDDTVFQPPNKFVRGLIIEINNITSDSKKLIRFVIGCIV